LAERVTEPEKVASMPRGWLGFASAINAAASGDLHRAVQRLRRLLTYVSQEDDPVRISRANERLAYYLLDIDAHAAAVAAARAALGAPPGKPPRRGRAPGPATHAQTLRPARR